MEKKTNNAKLEIFKFLRKSAKIRQNFEDNLSILANFGKFSRKTQKYTDFAHTF